MKITNITQVNTEFTPIDIKISITSEEEEEMITTFLGYSEHLTNEIKLYSRTFDKEMCLLFLNDLYHEISTSKKG